MAVFAGPEIVNTGLVLHLDAANPRSYPGSGTVWTDLSGNGNNGTLVNGVGYNSANNGSMIFDGVNDYAYALCPPTVKIVKNISLCLWAKWVTTGTSTNNIQVLVDNNHSANPRQGFVLQDRPDMSKRLTWTVYPLSTGVISTTQVGDGNWHHIVATYNGVISALYIDGKYDAQLAEPVMATIQPNISIGYWQFSSPSRFLNGNVSCLRVYDKALSQQEVRQNFEATRSRYGI